MDEGGVVFVCKRRKKKHINQHKSIGFRAQVPPLKSTTGGFFKKVPLFFQLFSLFVNCNFGMYNHHF